MGTVDYLVILVIAAIIGFAIAYIVKSKKSGKKCIGCPNSGSCPSSCGENCSECGGNCSDKNK